MTESWHPDENLLLEVALGVAEDEDRHRAVAHLRTCMSCRRAHHELGDGIGLTLAAVPRAVPPSGFETRVLDVLGGARSGRVDEAPGDGAPRGERRRPTRPGRRRAWIAVAVAALAGVALGIGGTRIAGESTSPDPPPTVLDTATPLATADGDEVGEVSRARSESGPQLIIAVHDGPPRTAYTCRVTLEDGTTQDVGHWELSADDTNVWVVNHPSQGVRSVELIGDSGEVWATADR